MKIYLVIWNLLQYVYGRTVGHLKYDRNVENFSNHMGRKDGMVLYKLLTAT